MIQALKSETAASFFLECDIRTFQLLSLSFVSLLNLSRHLDEVVARPELGRRDPTLTSPADISAPFAQIKL